MSGPGLVIPVIPPFELTVTDSVHKTTSLLYTVPIALEPSTENLHEVLIKLREGTYPVQNPPFAFTTKELSGGGHAVTSIIGINNDEKISANWKIFANPNNGEGNERSKNIDAVIPKSGEPLTFAYTNRLQINTD